jgi:predicted ATPase
MIYLKEITKTASTSDGFPFNIPAIANLDSVPLASPLVFLMGANATGKSTFLESLAIASHRIVVGGTDLKRDESLDSVRPLAKALKLSWAPRTARGFFLRAEDFFNFARRNRELSRELLAYAARHDEDPRVKGYLLGQQRQLEHRYGDLNAVSHGEGFLRLFQSRIVPGGLYLIDEPEAALAPHAQLAFLYQLRRAIDQGSQFVIATHSPIIASYPEAQILSFDHGRIERVAYDDLESVGLYRNFLKSPKNYLERLFRE